MKQRSWLHRISLFWWLQIGGWGLFGIYTFLPNFTSRFSSRFALFGAAYLGLGFTASLLLRHVYRGRPSGTPLTAGLVAKGLLISFLYGGSWTLLVFIFDRGDPASRRWRELIVSGVIRITSATFILLTWSALYFGIKYWQEAQAHKERALAAAALAHEAQLQMLRYQLNPHFFFNALNSIRVLISDHPRRAVEMVTQLSDFLRYSLTTEDQSRVTLAQELEAIRNYLSIEKIRFEERLQVTFSISPPSEKFKIPGFLLHPLVENAVKHGMKSSPTRLHLKIESHLEPQGLQVSVSNSGSWQGGDEDSQASGNTGTGLRNVRQRLEKLYPHQHSFRIGQENGWVVVRIGIHDASGN